MKYLMLTLILCASLFVQARSIELTNVNFVAIIGEINGMSILEARMKLEKLVLMRNNTNYKIYIVLDTPGGDVERGSELIKQFKHVKNIETITIESASMGSAIVEQMPGRRLCIDEGVYMFHEMSVGFGELWLTRTKLTELSNELNKYFDLFDKPNYTRIKMSKSDYRKKVDGKIWELTCDEAIKANVADEKVEVTCSDDISLLKQSKLITTRNGQEQLDVPVCPLQSAGIWRRK